jgi:hypothetical protein
MSLHNLIEEIVMFRANLQLNHSFLRDPQTLSLAKQLSVFSPVVEAESDFASTSPSDSVHRVFFVTSELVESIRNVVVTRPRVPIESCCSLLPWSAVTGRVKRGKKPMSSQCGLR